MSKEVVAAHNDIHGLVQIQHFALGVDYRDSRDTLFGEHVHDVKYRRLERGSRNWVVWRLAPFWLFRGDVRSYT
jgi:hypothetical protein